ncbi:hypothetical protein [Streptomyces virginiae]|uniref:Uncharacterized protein n=1 Tax=Streptomyces virginiae TaxID=1961 RepID=A0ABZ1TFQ6_STRVG|nr:hypothetical protein [Streptomyces virginiae]
MITPTLGAVLFGLIFLIWEIAVWYPGVKTLQSSPLPHLGDLLPFLICWSIGALTVMVVGGIVGWAGDTALWGLNTFGDGLLIYGVGAQTGTAPGSAAAPLTQGGLFMTLLILAAFIARRRRGATGSKWRGWLSGIGLGLTGSIARYAAVPLASGANLAGAWLTGMIS